MSIENKVHYGYRAIRTVEGVQVYIPACRTRSKVRGILLTRELLKVTCLRCRLKFTEEEKFRSSLSSN